jgi:hypothetical protein
MNKIKKEDLFRYTKNGFLTVGQLKKFIEQHNIPDNAPIIVERIQDKYYEGVDISGMSGCTDTENGIFPEGSKSEGWGVYLKAGNSYNHIKTINIRMEEEIVRRRNGEPGKFPKVENPKEHIVNLGDDLMNQYHPVWGPVFYKDDPDVLFLNLHY